MDDKDKKELFERAFDAASHVKSSGYLGGNSDMKMLAALEVVYKELNARIVEERQRRMNMETALVSAAIKSGWTPGKE
jgi:hypothetical protein